MLEPTLATKSKAPGVMSAPKKSSDKSRSKWVVALGVLFFAAIVSVINARASIVRFALASRNQEPTGFANATSDLSVDQIAAYRPGIRCPAGNEAPCDALRKIIPPSWSVDVLSWNEVASACGLPFLQPYSESVKAKAVIIAPTAGKLGRSEVSVGVDRSGIAYGFYTCDALTDTSAAWARYVADFDKQFDASNPLADGDTARTFFPGTTASFATKTGALWIARAGAPPSRVPRTGQRDFVSRAVTFNQRTYFVHPGDGSLLERWDQSIGAASDAHPVQVCGLQHVLDVSVGSANTLCALTMDGRLACVAEPVDEKGCRTLENGGVSTPPAPLTIAYSDTCILDGKGHLWCRPWAVGSGNTSATFSEMNDDAKIDRVIGSWDRRDSSHKLVGREICVERADARVCFDLTSHASRPFTEVPADATLPVIDDELGSRLFYVQNGAIQESPNDSSSIPEGRPKIPSAPASAGGIASFMVDGDLVLAAPKNGTGVLYWNADLKADEMVTIPLATPTE